MKASLTSHGSYTMLPAQLLFLGSCIICPHSALCLAISEGPGGCLIPAGPVSCVSRAAGSGGRMSAAGSGSYNLQMKWLWWLSSCPRHSRVWSSHPQSWCPYHLQRHLGTGEKCKLQAPLRLPDLETPEKSPEICVLPSPPGDSDAH